MKEEKIHPKIQKYLYDLSHSRYLEKSHKIVDLGVAFLFFFLGALVTYLIEGNHKFTSGILFFTLSGVSSIITLSYVFYRKSKEKRFDIVEKVKKLDPNKID